MQLVSANVGQKCVTAQSRCLDRPNARARRLCTAAAKSVEALDEGVLLERVFKMRSIVCPCQKLSSSPTAL